MLEDCAPQPFKGAVVDEGQDIERAIVQLVDGNVAGKVSQGPVQIVGVHLAGRLFSPGLHPVLDGGEGNEHAVIAPQVPTGGLIGQALLHDQSHRQGHDAMGVVDLGQRVVRRVDIEELGAAGTAMLRVREMDLTGPTGNEIPDIVQHAREHGVSKAWRVTAGTRPTLEIAAPPNDLRCG
jgi:hypothetical protein